MKKLSKILLALFLVVGLAACGSNDSAEGGEATTSEVSGKITLNGSTSMKELMDAFSETITEVHPDLELVTEYTGSSSGIKAATEGTAQIGNSSRALKDEEKEVLTENIICMDGIAVIVAKDSTVTGLTLEEVAKIYKGEITNWSEVGGADQAIVVIGRDSASGTRGAFEEIVGVEDEAKYAQEIESTGAVVGKVESTPGAIGYVSANVVAQNEGVKALSIDGAEATVEAIGDGSYPIARPFVMATKGAISEQSAEVQALFEYIKSDAGVEVIENLGLVPTK